MTSEGYFIGRDDNNMPCTYFWQVMHFKEPNKMAIDGGKVMRVKVSTGSGIVGQVERAFSMWPTAQSARDLVSALIERFERG